MDDDRIAAIFFTRVFHLHVVGGRTQRRDREMRRTCFHKIRDGRFYEQNFLLDGAAIHRQLVVNLALYSRSPGPTGQRRT